MAQVYTDRTAIKSMYTGQALDSTEQKIQLVVLYLSIIVGMMTFTGSVRPRALCSELGAPSRRGRAAQVVAVLKLTGEWKKTTYKNKRVKVDTNVRALALVV